MTVLIQLGSCGASWPQNTTPIQRLAAISPCFDRVVLVDTASAPSSFLKFDEYVRLRSFTLSSVRRVINNVRDENIVIWFGPSAKISIIILLLRLFMPFRFVVDLYDHEKLSSRVARARGDHLKAAFYSFFENFTTLAARRADLLVSAISETRYANLPNRVKTVNGVSIDLINAFREAEYRTVSSEMDELFTVCYVGLTNRERAGILEHIAAADFEKPIRLLLIGDKDPAFINLLRQQAGPCGNVSIDAPGFLPWAQAMSRVAGSDLCVYVFPTRPELDCVYPIKMGEYMALKKPVIATDTTAIHEIFSECSGVIRCDINSPQQWISAIDAIACDPEKSRELGRSNRTFALNELDWAVTQEALLRRLQGLLATKT